MASSWHAAPTARSWRHSTARKRGYAAIWRASPASRARTGCSTRPERRSRLRAEDQSLHELAGDVSDQLEVLVHVQDREPGKLGRRRDDEVGNGRRSVLAAIREQGEDLNGPVL